MAIKHAAVKSSGDRGYSSEWNAPHTIEPNTIKDDDIADAGIDEDKLKDGAVIGKMASAKATNEVNVEEGWDYIPGMDVTINLARECRVWLIFTGRFKLRENRNHPTVSIRVRVETDTMVETVRSHMVLSTDGTKQECTLATTWTGVLPDGSWRFRIQGESHADAGGSPHAYACERQMDVLF